MFRSSDLSTAGESHEGGGDEDRNAGDNNEGRSYGDNNEGRNDDDNIECSNDECDSDEGAKSSVN